MNDHPIVAIVRKPWEEVGKETYCGKPKCDECRVIDKVTQGGGSSPYHDERRPWKAQVIQVLVIDGPVPGKQYRVWIIELTRGGLAPTGYHVRGVSTPKFVIKTVIEHWSVSTGKWIYE